MPTDMEEFLRGVAILADNRNMRVTLRQSGKGAAVCGAMCFIGGLIGGPVGLAVGGTLGGVTAYRMTGSKEHFFSSHHSNHTISQYLLNYSCSFMLDFRSVGDIIRNDLTQEEKWRLHEHIVNSVRQINPADVAMLLPLILNTPSLQEAVLKTVVSFITNEMRYQIAN